VSTVRPFKALRPVKNYAQEFSCPPYDVLEENEVKQIVQEYPNSFLRVTRAEVEFKDGADPHSDVVYKKAAENIKMFEKTGVLIEDEKRCFYLYRETWKGRTQTGLFATFSIDEYDKGLIKKHELTRQDKEDDRARHIITLEVQAEPIFLTFKSYPEIKEILSLMIKKYDKLYEVTDSNGVLHEVWKVDSETDVNLIEKSFKKVDCLYIADGHHRAAASSRARKQLMEKNPSHNGSEEYNFVMGAIFPDDELRILDYNRVVKELNGMDSNEFLKKIEENFTVSFACEKPYSPKELHEIGMYLDKKWYSLKAKDHIISKTDAVKALDVSILQEYLLCPVLGIENPRKDPNIYFLGGIRGVGALEDWIDEKKWKVAFSMYPTQLSQLIQAADDGMIMPPKSTWFEPKLRSGLTIHKI